MPFDLLPSSRMRPTCLIMTAFISERIDWAADRPECWRSGGRARQRPTFFQTRSRGCTWVAVRILAMGGKASGLGTDAPCEAAKRR